MGNGLEKKPLFTGVDSRAIAHNEAAGSAAFRVDRTPKRDFPENRMPERSGL